MASGYKPVFEIYKDGENITGRFQDRATDIKVELASGNGAQDTCTITVDDRDWLVASPQVDDLIEIRLGYIGVGMARMGIFEIDEVNYSFPPKQIQIHGNSQGFNSLIKAPMVKEFDGLTLGQILEKIGQASDLSVSVHPDLKDKKVPFKNMTASPQQIISQLELNFGGVAKVSNGGLSFVPRDKGQSASGENIPLIVYQKEHFADYIVKHKNRSDYSKTRASYMDKENKRVFVDSNSAAKLGESAKDIPYMIGKLFPSKEEAQAAADSTMKQLDRNLGEGNFTLAEGDPWFRDQQRLLVVGCRDGVNGSYVADLVTHHYSKATGIKTAIKTEASTGETAFDVLYSNDPRSAYAPAPGQVIGEVLPSAPATPTPNTSNSGNAQGSIAPGGA